MKLYEFIEQVYDIKLSLYQKEYIEKLANLSGDIKIVPARGGNKTLIIGRERTMRVSDSVLFLYLIFREIQRKKEKNDENKI